MIDIRLREAITEVLEILKNADNTYMEKLPEKFKKFLNDNKSTSYIPEIDFSKELKDLKIRKETKELLGIMYLNYWSNDEEKKEYVKLLSENEKKYQEELTEKYNPDNLFKNKNNNDVSPDKIVEPQNISMVEYKKQGIFKRILDKITRFFKKN